MADLKNIGNGPYGGAITAALYLNEFVEPPPADEAEVTDGAPPPAPPAWLHLDMMAYNTGARPGRPEGGTLTLTLTLALSLTLALALALTLPRCL